MSRTLKQWEAYLSKQMPRVRLLSELGLNYQDMLEIANLIKGENKRHKNVRQTTKDLVDDFPCTFVAFLAAFAAQNTEREFWDAVARLIGVTGMELNNSRWRNYFIEILQKNHKPIFEDLSFVYVANMRIHGGIPSYSLRDFFANMLMPSIENPEYIELKGKELLDALMSRSAVQMFTDSTVRNFFENTEEIGIQYLESCRQVAKSYNSSRQIPSLHGLPSYVVDKLVNFIEYQEDEKHGLRRPRIKFDPEGDGLLVELPEEPISGADVRGSQVRWQVIQGQKILKEERARILRSGRDVHSEEQVIPLGYLIEPFHVTFSLPNEDGAYAPIRTWMFEIHSQEVPNLLVFRSEDGSLLRWSQSLPAHDLLLVHPKDISLDFEGDARLIHSPDMYAEGWHNWRAEYRSLAGAFSLSLIQNGESLSTISIQKQLELPRLIGNTFEPNLDPKHLYLGGAPKLRIPLRPGVDLADELKRWRVEINSAWEADPFVRQEFKLSEKAEAVSLEESSALEFDLSAVLGDEPKGTYTLRVRGPLETDIEFPFRVWTSLQVKDLPEFILPTEDSKVTLNFVLPVHASLEPQAGATGVNITGQYGRYAVELDETVSQLDLNLTWETETSVIHVPFSLPIPRVKWRLVLGEDSKVEWSNRSIRKPVDAFLQSAQTPALFVQMPGIEDHANLLTLRLIDPEKPKEFLQEFPVQASVLGTNHVRFLLSAKDTLSAHKNISVFEFQLSFVNKAGLYESLTLFSLTREIDVSNIRIEEMGDGLFLLWDEPSPLKNRRVFIRSMWKVWEDAWNIKIPDDVRGKFDLLAAGYGLPPSWYEVHFYVAPSWEQDIQSAPEHSTYIVKMISPEGQITWLDGNLQKHPENSFINHFERACIYSDIGKHDERDQEILFCYTHIDQAKPRDLFAFHEWLDRHDPNTGRAVRMKMFNPEQLKHLYSNHKFSDEFRNKYLALLFDANKQRHSINSESAILLSEKEQDPSIVFFALRGLMIRQDARAVNVIAGMVADGKLLDTDAVDLLKIQEQFSIGELSTSSAQVDLRLLSSLLYKKNNTLGYESLSNEKILQIANIEKRTDVIKELLGVLIAREDVSGFNFLMDRFMKGQILGEEVTEILNRNVKFSLKSLSGKKDTHAYAVQISELHRLHPIEAGIIVPGLYLKTPVDWARIDTILDKNGQAIKSASRDDTSLVFKLTFDYGYFSVMGEFSLQEETVTLYGASMYYQCGKCNFMSKDQGDIVRDHNRIVHGGLSPSFKQVPSKMRLYGDLQLSTKNPNRSNA